MLTMTYIGSAPTAHGNEHIVQFYEQDEFLLDEVSRFLKEGLQAGHACLVMATPQHQTGLDQRMKSLAQDRSLYVRLDAAATLSKLMVHGNPDVQRF